jgi:hypothetical protein
VRALLDEHPHLGVEPVLRKLHIPSSTYYRWRQAEKDPCEREVRTSRVLALARENAPSLSERGQLS